MSVATSGKERFLGRQAILDKKMNLYGYELLFRSGTENAFAGDAEDATSQTIDIATAAGAFFANLLKE